jgi:2-C-methyl-D-erythritol 2,4-cyclodiphosphate synthase
MNSMRIGTGFDVHKLVTQRPLILGGVTIPYHLGLDGHSDADVLVHAVIDSFTGPARLGDIGKLFPDTDAAYKNADSMKLLERVMELLSEKRITIINSDATIICQKPKLLPYIPEMEKRLSDVMGIPVDRISVKATTSEKLGFTGRGEGIAAQAVTLMTIG